MSEDNGWLRVHLETIMSGQRRADEKLDALAEEHRAAAIACTQASDEHTRQIRKLFADRAACEARSVGKLDQATRDIAGHLAAHVDDPWTANEASLVVAGRKRILAMILVLVGVLVPSVWPALKSVMGAVLR